MTYAKYLSASPSAISDLITFLRRSSGNSYKIDFDMISIIS